MRNGPLPEVSKNRLDLYEKHECIGRGSFGRVYRVVEKATGLTQAMKVLFKREMNRLKKTDSVLLERNALVALQHSKHVVRLLKTFQDKENLYFILEYANHGSLQDIIDEYGGIETDEVRKIMVQLVKAICDIHGMNIVHRDLKPGNILLNNNYDLMISDFGCVRMEPFEKCEVFVGSGGYMAPEMIEGKEQTGCLDIWALGVIMYQLLTGCSPFSGDSDHEVFKAIVGSEPTYPQFLDNHSRSLIEQMLEKDPTERIGFGEEKLGYPSIRNHPFFAGVDWNVEESIKEFHSSEEARKWTLSKEAPLTGKDEGFYGETVIQEIPYNFNGKEVVLAQTDRGRTIVMDSEGQVVAEFGSQEELKAVAKANPNILIVNESAV